MSVPASPTITSTGVTSSQARNLSDGNPDGICLGQSATDKISFYGTAPIVKPTLGGSDAAAIIVALVALGLVTAAP